MLSVSVFNSQLNSGLVQPHKTKISSTFDYNVILKQRAKKVVSDSPGLVDFAFGLVNSVLNLSDGQLNFFGKFKLQKDGNQSC